MKFIILRVWVLCASVQHAWCSFMEQDKIILNHKINHSLQHPHASHAKASQPSHHSASTLFDESIIGPLSKREMKKQFVSECNLTSIHAHLHPCVHTMFYSHPLQIQAMLKPIIYLSQQPHSLMKASLVQSQS